MYFGRSSYGYGVYADLASVMILCIILAVVGGIVTYFVFLSAKNEKKFSGFVGWLYEFLSFKKLLMEALLKIIYLILAIYVTLSGLILLFKAFTVGLSTIIIGNIVLRLIYEFLLLLIIICKNVIGINNKLTGKSGNEADMFVDKVELPKNVAQQFKPASEGESFCKSCGQKLKGDTIFCPNCGTKNE